MTQMQQFCLDKNNCGHMTDKAVVSKYRIIKIQNGTCAFRNTF